MQQAIIWGCGETAATNREKIRSRFNVIAYTDNNPALWGKEFDGVRIIPPTRILADTDIVVASEAYYSEIISSLGQDNLGRIFAIVNGEIVQYFPKNVHTSQLEFNYIPHKTIPVTLQLGLSSYCNSRCRYCLYHSEYGSYPFSPEFMSEDIIDQVIQQITPSSQFQNLTLIGDGETLLHPRWLEYSSKVLQAHRDFKSCTLYTNGMLLTGENINKLKQIPVENLTLVISIDGTSPEDCEYWRKGEIFPQIRKNVYNAYSVLGKTVNFVVSGCVVLPSSLDVNSTEAVETFLQNSGQWRKKEFPFAVCINGLALPFLGNIPGTRMVEASVFPKISSCSNPFQHVAVFANSDILSCPCGYIFKNLEELRIGNVLHDNLLDVFYENHVFNRLRSDLLNSKKPVPCGACNQLGGSKILCLQRI